MADQGTTLATERTDVPDLLVDLAAQQATGCLTVTDEEAQEAELWLRDGRVYSVQAPGPRPMLGVRLMSTGVVTPEVLALALEEQRRQRPPQRLGEVLVGLGVVEPDVVEAFLIEQQADIVADLLDWRVTSSEFRDGETTPAGLSRPVDVDAILAQARHRAGDWSEMVDGVGGADVVPMLATRPGDAVDVVLGPTDWALLCKIDGQRSLRALAADCGFTVIEAAQVVAGLHAAGLVECGPGDTGFRAPPTAPDPWESDLDGVTAALQAVLARSTAATETWGGRAADDVDPDDGVPDDVLAHGRPGGATLRLVTDDWVEEVLGRAGDHGSDHDRTDHHDDHDDADDAEDADDAALPDNPADENDHAGDDITDDETCQQDDPADQAEQADQADHDDHDDDDHDDLDGEADPGTTASAVADEHPDAPTPEPAPEPAPERVYTVLPSRTRMPPAAPPPQSPVQSPVQAPVPIPVPAPVPIPVPAPVPTPPPAPPAPLPAPEPQPVPETAPAPVLEPVTSWSVVDADESLSVLTAALREMAADPEPVPRSGDAAGEAPPPVDAPASTPVEPAPPEPASVPDDTVTAGPVEPTDTAALMRELSSLSAAEPEDEQGWSRPAAGRGRDGRRKRRGLFGR